MCCNYTGNNLTMIQTITKVKSLEIVFLLIHLLGSGFRGLKKQCCGSGSILIGSGSDPKKKKQIRIQILSESIKHWNRSHSGKKVIFRHTGCLKIRFLPFYSVNEQYLLESKNIRTRYTASHVEIISDVKYQF